MSKASDYAARVEAARTPPPPFATKEKSVGASGRAHVTQCGEAYIDGCFAGKDIAALVAWLKETFDV